jgi:hypothetical protein
MDLDDLMANAEDIKEAVKLGAPTFEEYCKNPKWRERLYGKPDQLFGAVDRGSENLQLYVQKHRYQLDGYECKSLEEVERVALSQGLDPWKLKIQPELVDLGGRKCDLLVRFFSTDERS